MSETPTSSSRPTLAVVIPTYLREKVLIDTLRLVLAQTPPADEVLVIDQTPEHEEATRAFLMQNQAQGAIHWINQSPPNLPRARRRAPNPCCFAGP